MKKIRLREPEYFTQGTELEMLDLSPDQFECNLILLISIL